MAKKPTTPPLPESLLMLQTDYVVHLKTLLLEVVQLKNALAKDVAEPEPVTALYRLIHNLCGSGSTFGFPAITQTGQRILAQLKPLMDKDVSLWAAVLGSPAFSHDLEMFERACHQAIMSDAQAASRAPTLQASTSPSEERRAVCIYCPPGCEAQDIDEQLRYFGYAVEICEDLPDFTKAIVKQKPDVLIVYSELSGSDVAELSALQGVVGTSSSSPQLIVISRNDAFEARLGAVRLGAQGYFTAPVDVLQVIDKIEQLVTHYTVAPSYHVLIVDDDEMLMKFYTHALERGGIITTSVSSPKEALEVIAEQSVDLILIDFLMPGCNGRELATIIRQHEKYVSMPIIFMSGRDDVESLLINTGLGIDDYLIKPITGDQLVSVVRSRARRSGELQALMARDSFTGLLNHGHFMDMLAMELGQVNRYKTHGAYALIDIDHFKQINDTYGHIAGDHVIKGLSRMLQQRLRRSDIIGRCGGEEFGIIMPDCDMANASLILESMRLQFADLSFKMDQHDIHVTFSAGLTTLEGHEDVDSLHKAVDGALYEAKHRGRNRLMLA